jgi:hypothetical protein
MHLSNSLINLGCVFALWVAMAIGCRQCRYEDFPGTITVTSITLHHAAPGAKVPDDPNTLYMVSFNYEIENNGASLPAQVRPSMSAAVPLTNKIIREKQIVVGSQYRGFTTYKMAGTCGPADGDVSVPEWGVKRYQVDGKMTAPRNNN